MKVAFLSNKLTLRGTEVNLYDYADHNETLLGNQSIIITRPYDHVMQVSPRDVHPDAYKKFQDRFSVYYYEEIDDVNEIIRSQSVDVIFIEKGGSPEDGLDFKTCKTIIHAVFTTDKPHGDFYTAISASLNTQNGTDIPVLPNIVRIHDTQENLRKELNIPEDAIVFGGYGGAGEYHVEYLQQAIRDISNDPKFSHIYFLFMNLGDFGATNDHLRFLPGTANMEYKKKLINTCNAMVYLRSRGETFGISCGEFSIAGKPVIAQSGAQERCHEDTLGDAMAKHTNYETVYDILTNWHMYDRDVSNNGYFQYTPDKVMALFKTFLDKCT